MRKYKDRDMQSVYDAFMKVDPLKVRNSGAMDVQFKRGFEGKPISRFVGRNSVAWAAYYAGVDQRKKGGTND